MRILHAADLHLDSPMVGLATYEEAPVTQLQMATRRALRNLVELAIDEHVDLVLLVGDVFDGDWAHYGTGVHFVSEMGRLREAGISVVMLAGNHDAESKLTKALTLPENVTVLSTRKPQTVSFEQLGLAVHGQGYSTSAVLDDLSAGYPRPLPDTVNVGMLHTSADGRAGHAHYAPCSTSALAAHGYDYWALGHRHRREVLAEEPPIVFPGILQGRGLRETGPKGATLVEFERDSLVSHKHHIVDVVRWEHVEVDAVGCTGLDDVCARVSAAIRDATSQARERLLAARVEIAGVSEAHTTLLSDPERLRYEVIAAATDMAGEAVWIESVRTATEPVREIANGGADAVGELIAELHELSDTEAIDVLAPLAKILPREVLAEFDPGNPGTVRALIGDVGRSLPVSLLAAGGD
jgi:DNA repair protein SbcD/Mre11